MSRTLTISAAALLGLAACAGPSGPPGEVAQAELAVRDAQTSGADEEAAAELQLASEKLERARRALDDGDSERARRLAAEATVDAQLAEARAEAASARALRLEAEHRHVP
jgi:hypothetical protein